jgi:hypothetical protein
LNSSRGRSRHICDGPGQSPVPALAPHRVLDAYRVPLGILLGCLASKAISRCSATRSRCSAASRSTAYSALISQTRGSGGSGLTIRTSSKSRSASSTAAYSLGRSATSWCRMFVLRIRKFRFERQTDLSRQITPCSPRKLLSMTERPISLRASGEPTPGSPRRTTCAQFLLSSVSPEDPLAP